MSKFTEENHFFNLFAQSITLYLSKLMNLDMFTINIYYITYMFLNSFIATNIARSGKNLFFLLL